MSDRTILIVGQNSVIADAFRREPPNEMDAAATKTVNANQGISCKIFKEPKDLLVWYGKAVLDGRPYPVCLIELEKSGTAGLDLALGLRSLDPGIEIVLCSRDPKYACTEMYSRLQKSFYFLQLPFARDEFLLFIEVLCVSWARKRELKESEERFRALASAISEGVLFQSRDGTIDYCSPMASRILGKPQAELDGKAYEALGLKFLHPDGSAYPLEALPSQHTLATGESMTGEVVRVLRNTGETKLLRVNTEPIWAQGQMKPIGVVVAFIDFSKQMELEKEMAEQRSHVVAIKQLHWIDQDVLMASTGDDPDRTALVVEGFLAEAPVEIERLRKILSTDNWKLAEAEATSFSQVARRIGATGFGLLLFEIGVAVSKGRRTQAVEDVERLAGAFLAVKPQLEEFL